MRIAMTGYGAVTPLGAHVEALWSGLLHGRSGICELDGLGGKTPIDRINNGRGQYT